MESETVFLAPTSVNPEQVRIFLRRWEAGDRYRPLGAPGSMKLQDQFVNRKISQEERGQLPVVINEEGTLLWVPGLPPNHEFRIQPQTEYALRLTYQSL